MWHDAADGWIVGHESPEPVLVDRLGEDPRLSPRWVVVVWNDPVNLMTYVTYVFRKLFGYATRRPTR